MVPSREFEVVTRRAGDTLVVAPAGDIDMATAPRLGEALSSSGTGRLVLDLRKVVFMDSQGIRLILEQQRRAEREGLVFEVVRGSAEVQRLLEMTGLLDRLRLIDAPGASADRDVHDS
jgi:anti-sigma B factor antagonist